MIQLVFSTTWGPFSWAIQRRTNSPWSHIDSIDPDGQNVIGALFWKGVVHRPLREVITKASTIGFANVDYVDEEAYWKFLHDQIGKPYDRRGVLGIGMDGRNWQNDSAWFCSELVAKGLLEAGRRVAHEDPCLITPRDVWVSTTLDEDSRRIVYLDAGARQELIAEFGLS
jgi:hypothetical protein